MRESKPQRCVQHHSSLKVTRNATNRDKHINEASKKTFDNNLLEMSFNYAQCMILFARYSLHIINTPTDDEIYVI